MNKVYPSDLTDSQWNLIKDFFPSPKATGRPRENEFRLVVNGISYITKTGIPRRYMPKEYPRWGTVYDYFRQWRKNGLWRRIHDQLRAALRVKKGRHKHATAGAIDSQSVKTTAISGIRGFDAGKKINGRKRHILAQFFSAEFPTDFYRFLGSKFYSLSYNFDFFLFASFPTAFNFDDCKPNCISIKFLFYLIYRFYQIMFLLEFSSSNNLFVRFLFGASPNPEMSSGAIVAVIPVKKLKAEMFILISDDDKFSVGKVEYDEWAGIYFITDEQGNPIPIDKENITGEPIGFCSFSKADNKYIQFSRLG